MASESEERKAAIATDELSLMVRKKIGEGDAVSEDCPGGVGRRWSDGGRGID